DPTLYAGERGNDLLFLLLLYGHHIQSHGCSRQYEEVWWLYSRDAARQADSRVHRPNLNTPHLRGGDLSFVRGHPPGLYDSLFECTVLFWWHRLTDCRRRSHGHDAANRVAPRHATLRKLPEKGSLARTSLRAMVAKMRAEEERRCGSFFWGPRLRERVRRPDDL